MANQPKTFGIGKNQSLLDRSDSLYTPSNHVGKNKLKKQPKKAPATTGMIFEEIEEEPKEKTGEV